MKYTEVKLAEIADIIMGQSPRSEYYNSDCIGLPFFQGSGEFGRLYPKEDRYCSKPSRIAIEGDVLISVRAPVGDLNITKEECCIGRGLAAIRPKNKSRYIYYLLKANQDRLQSFSSGTTYKSITKKVLHDFTINVPCDDYQRKIAQHLSVFDDFIENNAQRIETLERIAKAIYREWFIEYRFPGHEGFPLVDSELGMIPKGWQAVKMTDVLDSIEAGSRPRGGIDPEEDEIPSIGATNILGLGKYDYSKDQFISRDYFESMKRGIVQNEDVLLYKDGAKIGRKSLFRDGFPHEICCINSHVYKLRTNDKITQSYLYFWLDTPKMTQEIINLNTNAAQPGINQTKVKSLPIIIPDEITQAKFEEFIEPLLKLLFNLAKTNEVIKKIRDVLLPMLISGELKI